MKYIDYWQTVENTVLLQEQKLTPSFAFSSNRNKTEIS